MEFWVTARYQDGKVTAAVAASHEYDEGRTVTTSVAVEDEDLLLGIGAALDAASAALAPAVANRARFDAAEMLVASARGVAVGGDLGVAGGAAPQKTGG